MLTPNLKTCSLIPGPRPISEPLRLLIKIYYSEYTAGSVCGFSCPTGYTLVGPNSAVCLPDGNWSTQNLPTCEVRIMVSKWFQDKAKSFQPTWRKLGIVEGEQRILLFHSTLVKKQTQTKNNSELEFDFVHNDYLTRVLGRNSESELCVSDVQECCELLPDVKPENVDEADWLELLAFCASAN